MPPDRSAVFSHMVVEGDKLNTIVRLYLPPDGELTEFTDRIAALNELDDVAIITLGRLSGSRRGRLAPAPLPASR